MLLVVASLALGVAIGLVAIALAILREMGIWA
jgi:hypothetical protein